MPVLPLAQLGYLFIRTIAKPVAITIKNRMKKHPSFKKGCLSMAQAYHRWERKMKVNMMGIKLANVQPLTEEKAIELGANMLSETILFTVAGALISVDFIRRSSKEKEKESNKLELLMNFQQELTMIKQVLLSMEQDHQKLRDQLESHQKLKTWNFLPKKQKSKETELPSPSSNQTLSSSSSSTPPMDQTIQKIISTSTHNTTIPTTTTTNMNHSKTSSSDLVSSYQLIDNVSVEKKLQSMADSLALKESSLTKRDTLLPSELFKKTSTLDDHHSSRNIMKSKPWYYRSFKWFISTIDDIWEDLTTINESDHHQITQETTTMTDDHPMDLMGEGGESEG